MLQHPTIDKITAMLLVCRAYFAYVEAVLHVSLGNVGPMMGLCWAHVCISQFSGPLTLNKQCKTESCSKLLAPQAQHQTFGGY